MKPINQVLIVGGGTAGWLTACLLAANLRDSATASPFTITLIESATVGPIGVGEGTWPTMRDTLRKIGISETMLIKQASATFKQASKFINWHNSERGNAYYHPFSAPQGSASGDITSHWLAGHDNQAYADAVSFQPALCEAGLAPKTTDANGQGAAINYGYHLDATQFIALLREHGTATLGIRRIVDDVTSVACSAEGIEKVSTAHHGELTADLFVDCSGFRSLLLEGALGKAKTDCSDILFADTALACQQPYPSPSHPIASCTLSTAQEAGWIWDIGLQHRRGVGHVFSSEFLSEDAAYRQLCEYLGLPEKEVPDVRKINFQTGYNPTPWTKNCVGIGLSAGFLEPLEASALMLIEQAATLLATQFPAHTGVMPNVAERFNEAMRQNWESAITFLKLHYVLSNRKEPFWEANCAPYTIPEILLQRLEEWAYRPPADLDFAHRPEVFSAQSYRYVLYGMEGSTRLDCRRSYTEDTFARQQFSLNRLLTDKLLTLLPSHRSLIDHIIS